jgi:hypothetical protein
MKRIHIFRAGTHVPMQGAALSFAEADLAAAAAAYDPSVHEAPIVVGHPKTDAPAYGWIGALAHEGGDLYATPRQVDPAFAELVEAGRYKKVSASFYRPDAPGNPAPGAYYLRHVGFLGAQPPALKGLAPVEFAGGDEGVVTVEFTEVSGWRLGWMFRDVASLLRGLRDRIVAQDGQEAADRALPGDAIDRLVSEATRMEEQADAARAPSFASPPQEVDDVTKDELEARERELKEREERLAAQAASFAEAEAKRRRAEDQAFLEGLVAEGRIPAGLVGDAVSFMEALPVGDAAPTVAFGEGAEAEKVDAREGFRRLLKALPKGVDFGRAADPQQGDGTASFAAPVGFEVAADRLDLHRRALAYQKAHPGTDYATAAAAVERA